MKPSLSVCLPAYNEEPTIREVLEEIHQLLNESGLEYEVLICNDGSSDKTGEIIKAVASKLPNFRVIDHKVNQGIVPTIKELYAAAKKNYVYVNSVDKQWDTRIVFDLLKMTDRWDLIIASRKEKHYTPYRRFVSYVFNLVPRLLFTTQTYDAGASKLFKREILQELPNISTSPFSEAERIIRAYRAGYRITSYPVDIQPRKSGNAKGISLRLITASLRDTLKVWQDLRRQKGSPASLSEQLPKS